MNFDSYLRRACLGPCSEFESSLAEGAVLHALVQARSASIQADPTESLWTYPVPELSLDGSCSLHGRLAPRPYDLRGVLGGESRDTARSLRLLRHLLASLNERLQADWLGIYCRRSLPNGPALVKIAYLGAPSRAEFPLTPEFAKRSNNVRVGLEGVALVINDVQGHARDGGAYYECDGRVQSEMCVPLFAPGLGVCGIIDAESFSLGHFTPPRQHLLAALATHVPRYLPA